MNFELDTTRFSSLDELNVGNTLSHETWQTMLGKNRFDLSTVMLRANYNEQIGFSIITTETIDTLTEYLNNKTVLDLGSGSGYISHQLSKKGINILAVDNDTTHTFEQVFKRDYTSDAIEFLSKTTENYTDVILSWPPYEESFGNDILNNLKPGTMVWYLGESSMGCCADDAFFNNLETNFLYLDVPSKKLNEAHICFSGIHDHWQVYKKEN